MLYRVLSVLMLTTTPWLGLADSQEAPLAQDYAPLQQKLSGLQSYQARFTQTVTDAEGNVLQTSSGTLSLQQPDKLRWEVDAPNENILLADGTTLWHVDPFVEQVVAMSQADAVENNPVILLTSPDSDAWQAFSVENAGQGYVIRANTDESQIAALTLVFEQEQLTSLSFTDRQQQVSHLAFSEIQQNTPLAGETFEFVLPQGFDLDDQRTP